MATWTTCALSIQTNDHREIYVGKTGDALKLGKRNTRGMWSLTQEVPTLLKTLGLQINLLTLRFLTDWQGFFPYLQDTRVMADCFNINHADNKSRPLPNQYSILLKKNNDSWISIFLPFYCILLLYFIILLYSIFVHICSCQFFKFYSSKAVSRKLSF